MAMDYASIIPLTLIVSLVVIVVFLLSFLERKRAKAIERASMDIGFNYERHPFFDKDIKEFTLFKEGYNHRITNLLEGSRRGQNIQLFDLHYTAGHGKSRKTLSQSVFRFKLNKTIPAFVLSPENFFHRIGEAFGMQDIDYPEDGLFSNTFLLKGNEETVRGFFNSSLRSFLIQHDVSSLESRGNDVILFTAGKKIAPKDLTHAMARASEVIEQLVR